MTKGFHFQHPQLGDIVGCDGDVVSFRGIQYATLKHRLAEAQLIDEYSSPMDATQFGPTSPTPPGAFQLEMTLMQQSIPEPDVTSSDLNALNLNIWVPKIDGNLPALNALPVFVWIHGGGFVSGANSWPQYDMNRLVKLSIETKTPIIGVNINFRLGLLGYLTSHELRSAGYKPNNQLRDQRVALAWLRKYIAGFGGAEGEITVAGESTGAVDLGLHLQSEEPLFERALMTGGSSLLIPPSDADYQEWVYDQAIEALGLKSATPDERVRSLLTIPMDTIVTKLSPPLPYRPMVDDELVTFSPTYALVSDKDSTQIRAKVWLKALMVGDCQFDASSMAIFFAHVKNGICKKFADHLRKVLADHKAAAEELIEAYGFAPSINDDDVAFKAFLHYVNDVSYYAAAVAFVEGWSSTCHAFFVNERNPWPGMFQNEATHIMDATLLFQNFNEDLPPAMKGAAKQLAKDVFTLMAGGAPWPSCGKNQKTAKVYGPSSWDPNVAEPTSKIVDDVLSEETGRRRVIIDIGRSVGFDLLASVVGAVAAS